MVFYVALVAFVYVKTRLHRPRVYRGLDLVPCFASQDAFSDFKAANF